jgi:LSD1 subclass zinc finger protein
VIAAAPTARNAPDGLRELAMARWACPTGLRTVLELPRGLASVACSMPLSISAPGAKLSMSIVCVLAISLASSSSSSMRTNWPLPIS